MFPFVRRTPAALLLFAAAGCAPLIPVGPKKVDGSHAMVRLEDSPSDPSQEGLALAAAGDYAGAAVGFRRGYEADPSDDGALFNLALMREKLGDFARARDAYRAAIRLSDRGKYREGLLRVLNRLDLQGGESELAVRAGSMPPEAVARAAAPPLADLKLGSDAVPPEPKGARLPEPTAPVAKVEPPVAKASPPGAGNPKAKAAPPAPRTKPVEPMLLPARPRVLVLQTADTADRTGRATAGAAELVEWRLSVAGTVLLADTTTLPAEQAAVIRALTAQSSAAELAEIGRAAGADAVVLLIASTTAVQSAPPRATVAVRARIVAAASGREGEAVTVSATGSGDRADAAAAAALRKACEDLATKLAARL